MLREISQRKINTVCSLLYVKSKKQNNTKFIHTENRLVVAGGRVEVEEMGGESLRKKKVNILCYRH